jgi:Na+/H+ antiporter NhaD/arsenite permease-like protein
MDFLASGPGFVPSYAWLLPFLGILGCIAILPLIPKTHHWWEENKNKLLISGGLGGIVFIYLVAVGQIDPIHHALVEYVQFIMLLGSLYYISGGILLKGDIEATPKVNCAFLAIGAGLASFIGTTGASMLLIRPLLKTNSERKKVVHTVVFFIFIVSNIGGLLTPLGDPPLFLGFLKGVPFGWTFSLWAPWLFMNLALLFVYFIWDTKAYRSESAKDLARDETQITPLSLTGNINFLLLGGVIIAVAGSKWMHTNFSLPLFVDEALMADPVALKEHIKHYPEKFNGSPWREILMLGLAVISCKATKKGLREENKFSFGPILEVAALFIGIFVAMIPALLILKAEGRVMMETLGGFFADTPETAQTYYPTIFYWLTGGLSSFLDNAPTYLTFFELAGVTPGGGDAVTGTNVPVEYLIPISLGAVFMGANTYIGNGPNFMVKAVAEEAKVKMPSFFGYMVYSACVLIPLLIIVNLLFVKNPFF